MSVAEEGSSSGAQRPQQVDQPEASTSGAPAQPDYQALYEQVKSKPCKVAQIEQRLEGHNQFPFRTQPSLIERELAPIYDATTLSEVHQALETAGRNLQYLDVFREVNFLVHEQPEVSAKGLQLLQDWCTQTGQLSTCQVGLLMLLLRLTHTRTRALVLCSHDGLRHGHAGTCAGTPGSTCTLRAHAHFSGLRLAGPCLHL